MFVQLDIHGRFEVSTITPSLDLSVYTVCELFQIQTLHITFKQFSLQIFQILDIQIPGEVFAPQNDTPNTLSVGIWMSWNHKKQFFSTPQKTRLQPFKPQWTCFTDSDLSWFSKPPRFFEVPGDNGAKVSRVGPAFGEYPPGEKNHTPPLDKDHHQP